MNETLKTLSTIIIPTDKKLSLEEISSRYKASKNPSLLAVAFDKTFKFILHISENYYGLTTEDIASFSLVELDLALQMFEADNGTKFITYFGTFLKNKFREETQALNTHKRKAVFYSDSYEVLVEQGFDIEAEQDYEHEVTDMLQSKDLTDRESKYCELLIEGYANSEIANVLGVSVMTLCNMRKRIRGKLVASL